MKLINLMKKVVLAKLFVCIIVFFISSNAYADSDEIVWDSKVIDDLIKVWTVEFNDKIDVNSIEYDNDLSVEIVDLDNNKQCRIDCEVDGNKLLIEPIEPYEVGHIYNLNIDKKIKSIHGSELLKNVCMKFELEEDDKYIGRTNPYAIHLEAWQNAVEHAEDDLQYKYGIYVSRSMAVREPEIYLKADRLFYDKILKWYLYNEGSKKLYEKHTQNYQENKKLVDDFWDGKLGSENLTWSDLDVEKYDTVDKDEIYQDKPLFNYLDIRMYGLSMALLPKDDMMTSLNKAEILYFIEKEVNDNNPYILMRDDGKSYVYSDDILLNDDGEEINDVSGDICLVFNEDFVWYPLMDRDDCSQNRELDRIVEEYCEEGTIPRLDSKEKELVDDLKEVTKIDKDEYMKVLYYTSKLYTGYLRCRDFNDLDEFTVYDEENSHMRELDTGFTYFVINKNANYLSPITAHYAAMARKYEDRDLNYVTTKIMRNFNKYTNTGEDKYGDLICALKLWGQSELTYVNIDDTWLTKSSMCMFSASNMASIFELADIEDVEIIGVSMGYSDESGGHIHLAFFKDNECRLAENFHLHGEDDNGLENYGTAVFRGFAINQDWVQFEDDVNEDMIPYSTKGRSWVEDLLDDISDKSEGKAIIITELKDDRTIRGISIDKFIEKIDLSKLERYEY